MGAKAKAARMERRGSAGGFVINVCKVVQESRRRMKSISQERQNQVLDDMFTQMEDSEQFGHWNVAGVQKQQRRRFSLS